MRATHKITKNINGWYKTTLKYINPIGKFYHEFQILMRILLVNTFLKPLFSLKALKGAFKCDTKQVACVKMCLNRFAPISHWQLWNFELFGWMVTLGLFSFICNALDSAESEAKQIDRIESSEEKQKAISNLRNTKRGKFVLNLHKEQIRAEEQNRKNPIVVGVYMFIILLRIFVEMWFIVVEYNLNLNQSQNGDFFETMELKEKYSCYTHYDDNSFDSRKSVDFYMPENNRSNLFWVDDTIEACLQQDKVTCWIKFSRAKSYGMQIMFLVLICNLILSITEFIFALVESCCSYSSSNNQIKYE